MPTLRFGPTLKKRFDSVQVQVGIKKGKNATQEETLEELIDLWEQKEAGVQP